jgi:ATP-dependent Clp protease ATP-binding subunit ClpA
MIPGMREDFTKTLRKSLEMAQREARERKQEFVSTEALFLGVIACRDCEAERILRQAHLDTDAMRDFIIDSLPTASKDPHVLGDLPLSPNAQRSIQGAILKAQALRESNVSTRHLLLALLDEPKTVLREALHANNGDVNVLRHALVEMEEEET